MKNRRQYQGAFSEYDEDIQWNDFALRNYDPQIARWVQQDPYQQFASPYVALGGDPVNMVDPSGGWSLSGILEISKIGVAAVTTFLGAVAGGAATAGSGNAKGMIVGAFLGLASNFVGGGGIGGAAVQAVVGVTKEVVNEKVAMVTVAPQPQVISNTGVSGAKNINNEETDRIGKRLFIYPVLEALTPETYKLTVRALTAEKKPCILIYHGNPDLIKQKRNEVCPRTKINRPDGMSCQEYPPACTEEGGITKLGSATTGLVPKGEQFFEGAGISILITVFGMKPGDYIFVIPIARKYTPLPEPATKDEKRIKWYEMGVEVLEKIMQRILEKVTIPIPPFLPESFPQQWGNGQEFVM